MEVPSEADFAFKNQWNFNNFAWLSFSTSLFLAFGHNFRVLVINACHRRSHPGVPRLNLFTKHLCSEEWVHSDKGFSSASFRFHCREQWHRSCAGRSLPI